MHSVLADVAGLQILPRPIAAIELLTAFMRQEAGKPEIPSAEVDEPLLAIGNRFGGVLRRGQIERLTHFRDTRRSAARGDEMLAAASRGKKVKNPKQVIAIGLHEADASKYESKER
jgi:hypothetical protein